MRYDGQHKYDPFVVETLGRYVDFVRVCPESDCGMPTPRPPMRLVVGPRGADRRLVSYTGEDLTDMMQRFVVAQLEHLSTLELCGYVCKHGSPSSGSRRVKVHAASEAGEVSRLGAGLFTGAFMARFPTVPVEDEQRLRNPRLRESFFERIFCRRRWLDLVAAGPQHERLLEFHTDHELLLLTHGRRGHAVLGRLLARASEQQPEALFAIYEQCFFSVLSRPVTARTFTNAIMHILGHLQTRLTHAEKTELLHALQTLSETRTSASARLTLIKHLVAKYEDAYLARQVLFAPCG